MSWLSHTAGNIKWKWNKWILRKKVSCPVYGNVHSLFSNHEHLTQQQCDAIKADMRTLWDDETGFNPGRCSAAWPNNLTSWLGRRRKRTRSLPLPPPPNPLDKVGSGHLHHQESCTLMHFQETTGEATVVKTLAYYFNIIIDNRIFLFFFSISTF